MEKPDVPPNSNIVDLEDDHHPSSSSSSSSFINPISCRGSSKIDAISVKQYTNARVLHLSMTASPIHATIPPPPIINLDDYDDYDDDDDDVKVLNFNPSAPPPSSLGSQRKKTTPPHSILFSPGTEIGESSNSIKTNVPFLVCEICVEPKPMKESFRIQGCAHAYCTDCMVKYVASKLQDNVTSIRCPEPNCATGVLEPEHCRGILPPEVFDRWGNALCESALLASEKLYCPYKDCSALMIHDEGREGETTITKSECPDCKRLFCALCKAVWHPGIDCEEFQKLNKDEREEEGIMMMKLAKNRKWKRCPNCRFYMEKQHGCNLIKCRSVI